jgi:hypothetical protein
LQSLLGWEKPEDQAIDQAEQKFPDLDLGLESLFGLQEDEKDFCFDQAGQKFLDLDLGLESLLVL